MPAVERRRLAVRNGDRRTDQPAHGLASLEGSAESAGVRDGRLHDARHTAATVLLLLGVNERAIMDSMGWSTTAMAGRYAHVIDPIRADVAARVNNYLWPEDREAASD